VDGFAPTRDNMWKMTYRYYVLRPQAGIKVVVQTGNEGPRELDLKAKIIEGKPKIENEEDIADVFREIDRDEHLHRQRYVEMGDLLIWKMPRFDLDKDREEEEGLRSSGELHVDELLKKAAKHRALILDLRGNGGGYEDTLKKMVGSFLDHDVKIADAKRRKETKPIIAKTRGASAIKNDLIILIDSRSGSAAELLARVVQLEKRGKVIGDRSAGAVMRSQGYYYEMGGLTTIFYGASVTDADMIMADGKSLEHTGVMPDELIVPSGADLAAKRDPVLARAAALVGVELTAEKAGAMFPIEWK
jgi:C-terminal processing protease CtpA/Prc